jgi:hypothetical protein
MFRRFGALLQVGMVLAISGIGPSARAQDGADRDEEEPAQALAVFMTDEQFDRWVFPFGGAEKAAAQFKAQLSDKIRELDRMYDLTPEQKKKLQVAGNRDIQRFFDSVREKKAILDRPAENNVQLRSMVRELQMLRRSVLAEFPFGEGSLLAKTLKKNLAAEQGSRYNKAFYRSRVEWIVDSSSLRLNLSREERGRFVALILEETPPLKRYGDYDAQAVIFQASKLPRAKLEPILGEAGLHQLRERFREVRPYVRGLLAEGYIDGGSPEVGHSDAAEDEILKAEDVQRVGRSPSRPRLVEE